MSKNNSHNAEMIKEQALGAKMRAEAALEELKEAKKEGNMEKVKELTKNAAGGSLRLIGAGIKLGYHTAKEGTIRASGVGAKAGERDRTKVERGVNGASTAGFLGSLGYTLVSGDLTVGGAGMLASVGIRGRKQLKSGAKKAWSGLKWVFNELTKEGEPKASSDSSSD